METNTALPPVSETPAKPKRSVKKILLWVLGIPAAILLLLVSIGAWWLWGWKLSSAPDFHESWTAEERVALMKFDQYLRGEFCETLHKEVMVSDRENQTDEKKNGEQLATDFVLRLLVAPVVENLEDAMSSGHAGEKVEQSFLSEYLPFPNAPHPAIMASQYGYYDAMFALLNHGTPLDCTYYRRNEEEVDDIMGTLISPMLANGPYLSERIPWSRQQAAAEELIRRGFDINKANHINSMCAVFNLLRHEGDEPLLWALAHGLRLEASALDGLLGQDGCLPALELAVARQLTDVNAATESRTPLQTIAQRAVRCEAEEGERLSESAACMKLLLDAGADPNLLPTGDEDSSSGKETPLCIIEKELYKRGELQAANACCEPQESHAAILRRMADMLRAAGATPTPQEKLHEAKRRRTLRTLGLLDDAEEETEEEVSDSDDAEDEEEEPATEVESALDE